MKFDDLGLSPEVLKAVVDAGYEQPTPIQEKAIPYILQNRDVLGCAQTGTGKTASFTLPMIDILSSGRVRARMPRSLILTPTRELAAQIADNFRLYGKYTNLSMALLIGGVSFADQDRLIDKGVDVLIATPGRLIDHFERGRILLSDVKILVVDEADRMLDMGFIPDLERIVAMLPPIRQTLLFSATMPKEIRKLAEKFLMNPKEVSVAPPSSAAATVEQFVVQLSSSRNKRRALEALMKREKVTNGIIFCNRKRTVSTLQTALKKAGHDVRALHGDMTQDARNETLSAFRDGKIKFLIATDVAGRGLDIEHISHVFNYDVPLAAEDYIHRIGRTGRAGRAGCAFMLATPEDDKLFARVEKLVGKKIEEIDYAELTGTKRRKTTTRKAEDKAAEAETPTAEKTASTRKKASPKKRAAARTTAKVTDAPVKVEVAADIAPEEPGAEPAPAEDVVAEPVKMAEQPEKTKRTAAAKSKANETERRNGGSKDRRRRRDGEEETVGFGDHIPAFLLRPARPRPRD